MATIKKMTELLPSWVQELCDISGHGRSGKDLSKGGARHHHKVLCDSIQDTTKPTIHHLASSASQTSSTRPVACQDAITYTEHNQHNTVTAMDVVYVLKCRGCSLYGFCD
ncbi:uncharacterized protein LOC133762158 [Lepus europaeus]|uniref:uncharacterized protein LOC133762158 n=1 Tax=Lepus europaeus TaxID=9983 RepID=UPI002B4649AC|nr:uncharacterized protein LOC133762158 [Lepus europaeus]